MKQTKKCIMCGDIKSLSEFCLNSKMFDKKWNICKLCDSSRKKKYNRTKIGTVASIYSHQKRNCKQRNHPMPTYNKEQLQEWLFSQPLFHELHNKWVESGYDKWKRPSVDRINDYKSYSFDNIQLMTWKENSNKACIDMKNGKNNKQSKAVLQYDLDGNFIAEYYSIHQASRETGAKDSDISRVCKGKQKHSKGFLWKYI